MGIFDSGPHDEDSDEKKLGKHRQSTPKCLKRYTTKDAKGKTVTRVCVKKKGHWGKHQ